jgi:hypothetical protein
LAARADRKPPGLAPLALVCLLGCSKESTPSAVRDAAPSDVHSDVQAFAPTLPCEPTLSSIQANIFVVTCGFEYCHGASAAAGLWLLDPVPGRELLAASVDCPDYRLVEPGSPEKSLLFLKVTSDHPPCRTERMPFGKGRLPAPAIECIRGWITGLGASGDGSAP